ncbi:MAG: helix-turn-helix transcriptional regulator [Treponema sp.]|nr:helix-turn-helix transcriptional regulator [Treponema sp.]
MEKLRDAFIRNLKYYRKQKGLRQLDLALEIEKNTNYINSIENSKYFPSPETIEQIAEILGVEPMQLFDRGAPPLSIRTNPPADTKEIRSQLEAEILESISKAFGKIER